MASALMEINTILVSDSTATTTTTTTRSVVGIIHPPPEVRNIVDKTAEFVARIGPEFESKIRQTEANNPKFNFLHSHDPYHAYYRHKIREFADGKTSSSANDTLSSKASALSISGAVREETKPQARELIIPREPPSDFEFIYDPPSINALDLDIVKLTAQFVARNGRQFLTQLMNKEARNYQFDFLRPQHSLFNYFTKLVEQYTKILIPPKDLVSKLEKELDAPNDVVKQVNHRVDWSKYQERQRKREEEAMERERMSYALIDWHDFVVVETVDYQPNETGSFPPPTQPEEVGARVLARERGDDLNLPPPGVDIDEAEEERRLEEEALQQIDKAQAKMTNEKFEKTQPAPPPPPQMEEDDMQIDDEDETEPMPPPPSYATYEAAKRIDEFRPPPPPPLMGSGMPLPPSMENVVIRRDYDPKVHRVGMQKTTPTLQLTSPFTHEKLDPNQAEKHVRVGLLDSKWIEQRDREIQLRRDEEMVFAPGNLIETSLKQLAQRRTDIFGVGVDETEIGKRLERQTDESNSFYEGSSAGDDGHKSDKFIWDGHSRSGPSIAKRVLDTVTPEERVAEAQKKRIEELEREKIGPQTGTLAAPSSATSLLHPTPMPPPRPVMLQMTAPNPVQTALLSSPFLSLASSVIRPAPMPMAPNLLSQVLPGSGQSMPQPPHPSQQQQQQHHEAPPPSKKARSAQEDNLVPEEKFLADNGGPMGHPITFKVFNANNHQTIDVTLKLVETIGSLKNHLAELLGMPVAKQKLQDQNIFLKDTNSLAFYNFKSSTVVHLLSKERGGRKK